MHLIAETVPLSPAEYVPENYFRPFDFESIFARSAPIEVDLGCGDGAFLVALAKQNLKRNFLGIERLVGRVRSGCRKISRENLNNARVCRIESSYAVAYLFPSHSVSVFYLLFPDPWPKRRHHPRRLVRLEFLASIHRNLADDGLFVFATDDSGYFAHAQTLARQTENFVCETPDEFAFPPTTFEKHFRERGLVTHRLVLRKVSPVR